MTSDLSDDELEALLEESGARSRRTNDVRPRDFARSRRFSEERLDEIARTVRRSVPEFVVRLGSRVRGEHRATLAALVEERGEELIERAAFIAPAIAFDCGSETGFLLWDAPALVAACELALGAGDRAEPTERRLSPVEEAVLLELTKPLIALVAGALALDPKNVRLARDRDAFPRFDEGGTDPLRLGVQIALEGPTGSSTLRFYVPASRLDPLGASPRAKVERRATAPPAHLAPITIEVAAEIGALDVPLRDLLALEVGDVLALPTQVGAPATLVADGRAIATASFGEMDGALALRVSSTRTGASAERRGTT